MGACLFIKAIPHNSKCRYGERGAADAKPKAQIILDAAKVSAASGGYSEPKQGQRSQSARGFCPRSTMRVPQPDIIEHFGNADAVPQPPERCLSRKAGIVRCCLKYEVLQPLHQNDQDQHGQYKAEVVLQPAGHLEAAAGVALGQVVVKIPAPAGDAEQQVDEAAAGQQ